MRIYEEELSDATRYLQTHKNIALEDKAAEFAAMVRHLSRFLPLNERTRVLEIRSGTGWLLILFMKNGVCARGLEISAQLADYAREQGRKHGVPLDIELGNIEQTDIGRHRYDIIIAKDTFEHVEHWQTGLRRVYEALNPGGVFYFTSTSKYSIFRSDYEYDFPFYGWLPNRLRYALRIARQGPDIMKLGIDFNQFTYGQLRRFFRKLGFSKVLDRIDCLDPDVLRRQAPAKRHIVPLLRIRPIKDLALLFSPYTAFTCVK